MTQDNYNLINTPLRALITLVGHIDMLADDSDLATVHVNDDAVMEARAVIYRHTGDGGHDHG